MLCVTIHAQSIDESFFARSGKSQHQCSSLSAPNRLGDYNCARLACEVSGAISGTVIHYKNGRDKGASGSDNVANSGAFIEAGNHDRALLTPVHSFILGKIKPHANENRDTT